MIDVRVHTADFDPGAEIERLGTSGVGGIATFIGLVRGGNGLVSLTLDHYPAMTQRALEQLGQQALDRWSLDTVTIVHRVGSLPPGARIVFVGTASPHRQAALDGCAFLIDALKTRAPFWKRERFEDGRDTWVDAKSTDDEAVARWG
jgi:molybdopterin synthase catalytic subunit